jgi:hypothetical protein
MFILTGTFISLIIGMASGTAIGIKTAIKLHNN